MVNKLAQISTTFERDTRHVHAQQCAEGPNRQVFDRIVFNRHLRHDANAQTQTDIGLDHVRVDGFQRDAGVQFFGGKGLVNPSTAGK